MPGTECPRFCLSASTSTETVGVVSEMLSNISVACTAGRTDVGHRLFHRGRRSVIQQPAHGDSDQVIHLALPAKPGTGNVRSRTGRNH